MRDENSSSLSRYTRARTSIIRGTANAGTHGPTVSLRGCAFWNVKSGSWNVKSGSVGSACHDVMRHPGLAMAASI